MKNMKKTVGIISTISLVLLIAVVALFVVFLKVRESQKIHVNQLTDIEWYSEKQTEFIISTAEELYDLATLSDFYDFKGQTIKLDADIVLNEGNAKNWDKVAPVNKWFPIEGFAGTFDGQGHTISGVYAKFSDVEIGLFNDTDPGCVIQDFKLVNSYFYSKGFVGCGAIAGDAAGTFKRIYTDAIVEGFNQYKAGMIGRTTGDLTMEECWFDGSITNVTDIERTAWSYISYQHSGGLIGGAHAGNVTVAHCLNTGVNHTKATEDITARFGGIIGSVDGDIKTNVVIKDTFFAGTLSSNGASSMVATIVGRQTISNGVSTPLTITNTYALEDNVLIEKLLAYKIDRLYQAHGPITTEHVKMFKAKDVSGVQAYQKMNLDYENYWVLRDRDVPTLQYFAPDEIGLNAQGLERAADMVKDTSWLKEAKGTAEDPYILKDVADLYGFASLVNGGNIFIRKTVKLGADITVNKGDAKKWGNEEPLAEWIPMQNFAGTFDGAGHTISGLYYKKTTTNTEFIGLFGTTQKTAVIQNVQLKNSYFAYKADKDSVRMGSVVGAGNGRIENVYSNAIVENAKFGTGGIIGSTREEDVLIVSNCWFDGEVKLTSKAAFAGGIVGMIAAGDLTIEHCLNSGTVQTNAGKNEGPRVGGIIGSIDGGVATKVAINDCLNVGKVITGGATSQVSSLVGRQKENAAKENTPLTLTNSFAISESVPEALLAYGSQALYQATGEITVDNVKIYSTKELTGVGAYQRTSLDFAKYWVLQKNGTPVLKTYAKSNNTISVAGLNVERAKDLFKNTSWYDKAKGTASDPYILKTAEDLYGFAYLVNNGNDFADKTVKLAANITINKDNAADWAEQAPISSWTPMQLFAGTFDGAGYEISGLYYKKADPKLEFVGLFGETTKTAIVRNLSIANSYFTYVGEQDAVRMGSFAGVGRGKFENLYSNTIFDNAYLGTGGIVGATDDTLVIRNSWFDGKITARANGKAYAGGIVGLVVSGNTAVENCLNSGMLHSNSDEEHGPRLGGIIGSVDGGDKTSVVIYGCLNTGLITTDGAISQVAAILGFKNASKNLTISNTYATTESIGMEKLLDYPIDRLYQARDGATVSNVEMLDASRMTGVLPIKTTKLDFDGYWVAMKENTPKLATFIKNQNDVADTSVLIKANKDWFNEALGTKDDPYVLMTKEDLLGFAEIANSGYNFSGRVVTLGQGITFNNQTIAGMLLQEPFNVWEPIREFAGTFDGNGFTIKGLYKKTGENIHLGLFGTTTEDSLVYNVRLEESYFEYAGTEAGVYVGSIAGYGAGVIDTVYSSAELKHNQSGFGGLVGVTESTLTITNSWFAGKITLPSGSHDRAGGILGFADTNGTVEISHCLNTGVVDNVAKVTQIGGILGYLRNSTVTITDCLNAGTVDGNGIVNQVTALVGRIDIGGALSIDKTYATYESLANMNSFNATHISQNQHLYQNNKGSVEWENIEMLSANGASGYRNITDTDAYVYTLLQFGTYWSAIEDETPILTSFVTDETVKSVAGLDRIAGTSKKWLKEHAGTEKDPYVLKDAADLYGLATLVNNGNDFAGKHIVLEQNITVNASDRSTWGTKAPINTWIPIGNASKPFAGHFDGNGKSIIGLYETQGAGAYFGLFGATTENTVIENLRLTNSKFVNTKTGDSGRMGSIVGLANGGTFRSIYSDAHMMNGGLGTAGIVGVSIGNTVISDCWFDGDIKATSNLNYLRAAGIAGWVDSGTLVVEHCLNSGTIYGAADANKQAQIGGLVATTLENVTRAIVRDSLNTGKISTAGAISSVSTIIGLQKSNGTAVVTNSYATIESCPDALKTYTNDYLLQTWPGKTTYKEQVVMMAKDATGYTSIKGIDGYKNTVLDFDNHWTAVAGETPILTTFVTNETIIDVTGVDRKVDNKAMTAWYSYFGATGTKENPYVISNAAELYGFKNLVTNGTNFAGKYVVLANDITVNASNRDTWTTTTPQNTWAPIGTTSKTFAGHFNGQGHTISGLYQPSMVSAYGGLFVATAANSTIENLRLTNSKFVHNGTGDSGRMGSIVALAWGGTVQNVYSDAKMINGGIGTAGIVGISAGGTVTISNCWFAGDIQLTATEKSRAGGLVGWVDSGTLNIEHCLNSGTIRSASTAGKQGQVGGLVGYVRNVNITLTIQDSLNTGKVSTAGSTSGVSTIIAQQESTGTVHVKNTYATIESCDVAGLKTEPTYYLVQTWPGKVTNTQNVAMVAENAAGFATIKGEAAKTNTTLDFTTYWKTVEGGTPILKSVATSPAKDTTLQGVQYVDVIIFAGQSNMQGQSDALTSNAAVSRAYEYKWLSNALTALKNPVGEDIKYNKTSGSAVTTSTNLTNWLGAHVTGSSAYGHTNLVPKFCESYIEQTDTDIVAVHVAKGSTKIDYWLPGTPGYEMIVEKATSAIEKAEESTVVRNVYFVWFQGESDALASTTKATYKQSLITLNNALKEDVGIDKFGIIRVGRFAEAANVANAIEKDNTIITAQDEICQENTDFLMLTTIAAELNSQPEYMNPNVAGHYSATGLEKIGKAAGITLGQYVQRLQQ